MQNETDIIFAEMQESDYPEVYALWQESEGTGLRSLDDSREGIRRFLSRNPGSCFIARTKGKIIGVILAGHDGRRGYIYHTAVAKSHQRQGIGSGLVDKTVAALEEEGIKKAALLVYTRNRSGNGFWESKGFTERNDVTYRNFVIDPENS